MEPFWDRALEMARLRAAVGRPAFGFVTGRRRVGKTALLCEAARRFGGLYHQAVEGAPRQQLLHLAEELRERLPLFRSVVPKDWSEFFGLLSRENLPRLLVFDEFPYWVQGDPALPSLLQKWIDHELPKRKATLLISGSSQSMLYSALLRPQAPLYGRATLHLDLAPLSFRWFCRAMGYDDADPASFSRYALTGGIPHYWKLLPKANPVEQAHVLYFEPGALLAEEPGHWLREEAVSGSLAKALLDFIGRGVSKPSELAARIGTVHGNLTRPLSMLLQLGLVQRELPFGESMRTTKRVLYSITDPALSFYFRSYLPNRGRWRLMNAEEKSAVVHRETSMQWETYCRKAFRGSSRYWEGGVELDLVREETASKPLLVAECKWKRMDRNAERAAIEALRLRFLRSSLARKHRRVDFRVLSQKDLKSVAIEEERYRSS